MLFRVEHLVPIHWILIRLRTNYVPIHWILKAKNGAAAAFTVGATPLGFVFVCVFVLFVVTNTLCPIGRYFCLVDIILVI